MTKSSFLDSGVRLFENFFELGNQRWVQLQDLFHVLLQSGAVVRIDVEAGQVALGEAQFDTPERAL